MKGFLIRDQKHVNLHEKLIEAGPYGIEGKNHK